MDAAEFDRMLARARDPLLIPGIYNYCDGRCRRCPFTERCLTFRNTEELAAAHASAVYPQPSLSEMVGASLRRTMDVLIEVGRRVGLDLAAPSTGNDAATAPTTAAIAKAFEAHDDDPLVAGAREYSALVFRIAKALDPIVAARGDPIVIDAVDTIDWFGVLIGSKLYRAVAGAAIDGGEDEAQADHDGSVKVALIGIAESVAAWRVLMDDGRATANGVPARAVQMLHAIDATARARFPGAMAFVRPGFDEPEIAAGALSPRRDLDLPVPDDP